MLRFRQSVWVPAPVEKVFAFHEREDVLALLTPPWQEVRVLERSGGLKVGAKVIFQIPVGPFAVKWVARHVEYEKNRVFADEQVSGPFGSWLHRHVFEAEGEGTRLTDDVQFSLKGGRVADLLGGWIAKHQLRRLFNWRHKVTKIYCS